jgi:hypothetical protein
LGRNDVSDGRTYYLNLLDPRISQAKEYSKYQEERTPDVGEY